MKRKKLFCCGILLALCLGIHGWAAPSDLLLQEGEMDFDQVYELLTALTPEELLTDMERAYEVVADSPHGEEEDVLTPWTAAMIDRLDEFSDEDLLSIILDKSRSTAFRAAVIQLREMQTGGEETDERLYQMLLDEQEEEYLRTTLLLHLELSTPSQQQLLQRRKKAGVEQPGGKLRANIPAPGGRSHGNPGQRLGRAGFARAGRRETGVRDHFALFPQLSGGGRGMAAAGRRFVPAGAARAGGMRGFAFCVRSWYTVFCNDFQRRG